VPSGSYQNGGISLLEANVYENGCAIRIDHQSININYGYAQSFIENCVFSADGDFWILADSDQLGESSAMLSLRLSGTFTASDAFAWLVETRRNAGARDSFLPPALRALREWNQPREGEGLENSLVRLKNEMNRFG
jgi:hypothetical protein